MYVFQLLHFDVNEEQVLTVMFDVAHIDDFHSCSADDLLTIAYNEHPHVVSLTCALKKFVFFYFVTF